MACTRELGQLRTTLNMVSVEDNYLWDAQWHPSTGVGAVDFVLDVRNTATGAGGAAFAVKPALQFAPVRTDRPDPGVAITAGSDTTASGLVHYLESLSASTKFWFRRGLRYKLTAGTYARAEVALSTSFRSCGTIFPAQEVLFNPFNDTAVPSYFPITGPFSAVGADKGKIALLILDNLNNKMEWRLAGRAFNDPSARGSWVDLMSGWQATTVGDSAVNSDEVSLSGLSVTSNSQLELALAVRKDLIGSGNSRCIFHVLPAVTYA